MDYYDIDPNFVVRVRQKVGNDEYWVPIVSMANDVRYGIVKLTEVIDDSGPESGYALAPAAIKPFTRGDEANPDGISGIVKAPGSDIPDTYVLSPNNEWIEPPSAGGIRWVDHY